MKFDLVKSNFFKWMFAYLATVSFIVVTIEAFFGIRFDLFFPNDRFADFFKTIDGLHLAELWKEETIYDNGTTLNFFPPLLVFLYFVFSKVLIVFNGSKLLTFFIYIFLPLCGLYLALKKEIKSVANPLLILISFPILFSVERANPALWVVALIFLSVLVRKNIFLSVFFLAIAVSLKITPIIFLFSIISKKRKELVFQILFFITFLLLINCSAIYFLSTTSVNYNPHEFFDSLKFYENLYIRKFSGLNYGASFFMPIYFFISKFDFLKLFIDKINPYLICLIFCILFFLFKSRNFFWKYMFGFTWSRIDILSMIFILFTPVTGIYYLLLMLGSLLIRFDELEKQELYFYFFLLSPKVFRYFGIEIGAFINPLLLVFLLNRALELDVLSFSKNSAQNI